MQSTGTLKAEYLQHGEELLRQTSKSPTIDLTVEEDPQAYLENLQDEFLRDLRDTQKQTAEQTGVPVDSLPPLTSAEINLRMAKFMRYKIMPQMFDDKLPQEHKSDVRKLFLAPEPPGKSSRSASGNRQTAEETEAQKKNECNNKCS